MRRNKDWYSVAVRKSDNTIEVEKKQYKSASQKNKILGAPFIRGVFSFIDSLVLGIKSLTYSASFFEDDDETEEEPGKLELWLINKFGEKAENVIMGCVVAVSIIFSVLIFMMLPLFIADMFERFVPGIGNRRVPGDGGNGQDGYFYRIYAVNIINERHKKDIYVSWSRA